MENYGIIEVWFANGNWRQYPKVDMDSIYNDDTQISFIFGNKKHTATICKANVNFFEFMYNEEV